MKLMLAGFLFSISFSNAFAIDVGDGSDGACTNATFIVSKRYYQCTTLTLNAPLTIFKAVGGAPLVIKVQEDATITALIDLDGNDGLEGINSAGKTGGLGGAGGSSGGSSPGLKGNGTSASDTGGANGARGGKGGKYSAPTSINGFAGGGGGGGSFKTQGGVSSTPGEDLGVGPVAGTEGASGLALGDETTLDSTFTGGAGGGAGGDGEDLAASVVGGSSGGGGGGAIRIIAGRDIILGTTITANGGDGGGQNTTEFAGAGGAGSGGAIFFQAGRDLIVNAGSILEAKGGLEGNNNVGPGGSGGLGIIRLDDSDGIVDITGSTVTQGKYSATFTATPITSGTNAINRQYSSGVSCASVVLDDHEKPFNHLINLILGLGIAGLAHYLVSRKSKV